MPTRKKNTTTSNKIPPSSFLIAAAVAIVILLLGFFKNQFIVATVNGEAITRIQLLADLEKKQGKTDLNNLITEKLILQEAKHRNVSASDSELGTEIKSIEKNLEAQGQKLDTLLAAQNVSRNDLKKQVKIQLLLKKMIGNVEVSEKEIADFMDKNRNSIPQGTDEATIKTQAKQQIEQQKTGEKIQTLVSELQQKAKINYLLKL